MTNTQNLDKFIRIKDVAAMFGVTKQTIWGWCNPDGERHIPNFPKPIKLSPRATVFSVSELEKFQEQRKAKRETLEG